MSWYQRLFGVSLGRSYTSTNLRAGHWTRRQRRFRLTFESLEPKRMLAAITFEEPFALLPDQVGLVTYPPYVSSQPIERTIFKPVVADFNGDGSLDVVTNSLSFSGITYTLGQQPVGYGDTWSDIQMLFNNGDGSFASPAFLAGLNGNNGGLEVSRVIAAADFNEDGSPDLAAIFLGYNTTQLVLFLNDGAGGFSERIDGAATFGAQVNIDHFVVADFDGDGRNDFALGGTRPTEDSLDTTAFLDVVMSNGNGSYSAPVEISAGWYVRGLQAADMNGDGKADLVAALNSRSGLVQLSVLTSLGGGNFDAGVVLSDSVRTTYDAIAVSDLNGDGKLDVAAGLLAPIASDVAIFLNQTSVASSVLFSPPNLFNASQAGLAYVRSIVASDMNGDSLSDLVVGIGPTFSSTDNSTSVLLNDGTGQFSLDAFYADFSTVAAADFNRDGRTDLIGTLPQAYLAGPAILLQHSAFTVIANVVHEVTNLRDSGVISTSVAVNLQNMLSAALASIQRGNDMAASNLISAVALRADAIINAKTTTEETALALQLLEVELYEALSLL